MLSTVHAYLNIKKNELHITLGKIESNILAKHPDLSISDTKLSKIFKDPNYRLPMEELFVIVEAMGLDKREILSILGEQEYRASADVGHKGTIAMSEEYTAQIIALEQRCEGMQESFSQALDAISSAHASELSRYDRLLKWWRAAAFSGYAALVLAFCFVLILYCLS